MLLTEWNWDDTLDVRYEEGLETGEQKKALEIARNLKAAGISVEIIYQTTGLNLDE